MLKIWTSADQRNIRDVIGTGLMALKPNIPDHQFISFDPTDTIPIPETGDLVLVCGTKCLTALQQAGYSPKKRKVTSMRETLIQPENVEGHYLVTFDPGVINSEPHHKQTIHWDIQLAARFLRTGSLEPDVGEYEWVPDWSNTIEYIEDKFEATQEPVPVCLDTETMGLYPWYEDKDLVTIQITVEPGQAQVMYLGLNFDPCPLNPNVDIHAQLKWILTSPKVKLRGANLKYDLEWIAVKLGIECTNFKFDSLLVGSLLDENRSNSLNMHAKILTPMGGYDDKFNATYDKGHMEDVPPHDLLGYAGGDTDAGQQSADKLLDQIMDDPELARFYVTILHPAARTFEKIERRGVLVDQGRYQLLREDLTTEIDGLTKQTLSLLPAKLKEKYRDKINSQLGDDKNPFTPKILHDFFFTPEGLNLKPKLYTEKSEKPVLARHHLKMFEKDTPVAGKFINSLEMLSSASKMRSTFVDGFLKHLRPDGRFHPSYMLFHGQYMDSDAEKDEAGSTTGRLSAKDPAIQTVPKKTRPGMKNWAKRIRECFVAPPGKVLVSFDYSQGELRVVACIANELNMLKAYAAGLDLHAVTGAQLGGVSYDEFVTWKETDDAKLSALYKDFRDRAKAGNFGLLYGMGVDGFIAYAWANYGLQLTYLEAERIRNAFFDLYPGLIGYHGMMKQIVSNDGQVRSPFGRVRHLPTIKSWDQSIRAEAQRQAINAPVQATLTDMMIWALSIIDRELGDEVEVVAMIHDAFIGYMDESKFKMLSPQVQQIMSNLPFDEIGWEPQLDFPADAEYGLDLAHLGKIPLAA